MITYESLKELAHALSKVTGYRFVSFGKSYQGNVLVTFSDSKMSWHKSMFLLFGVWLDGLSSSVLYVKDLPNLDWSKCQFDCKESDNEED